MAAFAMPAAAPSLSAQAERPLGEAEVEAEAVSFGLRQPS